MGTNKFQNVTIKEGYTLLAIVEDGCLTHAIIRRENAKDYVFCYAYDVTDGTWGNGYYFSHYSDAVNRMCATLI